MKLGRLIEHPKGNIFLSTLCKKCGRETSHRPLFVFLKRFKFGKSKWSAAWFHYISIALKLAYNRSKLFKALHYWSVLNFNFLGKGLGIVSPAHFLYDVSTKMFLTLCSIIWPNFISLLPLLLEILGNMSLATVCYPGCDVMDFEINLIFLLEPLFRHDQKVMTKTSINKKSF